MHDASARIPMIASLPGYFESGTTCTKPVSLVDLAPTFLNLAGAKITSHQLDGEDLTAIASGKTERQYIFAQHAYTQNIDFANQGGKTPQIYLDDPELEVAACSTYMALSEKWKYFYSAPDNCEFLFDKLLDSDETSNRAGISFYDDKLKELRSAMHQHLTVSGKTKGIESGNWREFPKKTINANPDAGLLIQDGYAPWADTTLPGSIQISQT
jgi:arylsulfatase